MPKNNTGLNGNPIPKRAKNSLSMKRTLILVLGGDDGNRTRVRKPIRATFSGRSLSLLFPHHRQTDTPVTKKACITAPRTQTLP